MKLKCVCEQNKGNTPQPSSFWLKTDADDHCNVDSSVSIITLLVSIVAARFGLWLTDLSITQIMQEGVEEQYRGTVG
jgi:hypothetical protein